MRPLALLVILAGLLLPGCHGTSSQASDATPACICGTHAAKIHGCHAPECVSGKGNPNNPQCTCAALTPAKGK